MIAFVLLFAVAFSAKLYIKYDGYYLVAEIDKCYKEADNKSYKYTTKDNKYYLTYFADGVCTQKSERDDAETEIKVEGPVKEIKKDTIPEHKYFFIEGKNEACSDHNDRLTYLIEKEGKTFVMVNERIISITKEAGKNDIVINSDKPCGDNAYYKIAESKCVCDNNYKNTATEAGKLTCVQKTNQDYCTEKANQVWKTDKCECAEGYKARGTDQMNLDCTKKQPMAKADCEANAATTHFVWDATANSNQGACICAAGFKDSESDAELLHCVEMTAEEKCKAVTGQKWNNNKCECDTGYADNTPNDGTLNCVQTPATKRAESTDVTVQCDKCSGGSKVYCSKYSGNINNNGVNALFLVLAMAIFFLF